MSIIAISGSTRQDASNVKLIHAIAKHSDQDIFYFGGIGVLPLFNPDLDHHPWPPSVIEWRNAIAEAQGIIITTPAYLHNIPAILKNALEWVTSSGELDTKPTLPITYTPFPPRGERAMQSLLWSLGALNARIVVQLPLYQSELKINDLGGLEGDESIAMIEAALSLL